jgi:hypothetical protein
MVRPEAARSCAGGWERGETDMLGGRELPGSSIGVRAREDGGCA